MDRKPRISGQGSCIDGVGRMFSDDAPPAYDSGEYLPSPTYSTFVGNGEHLLQFGSSGVTGCPTYSWIMENKYTRINLGPRIWGLDAPSYGLDATVDGSIQFLRNPGPLEGITVTLEGVLKIAFTHRRPFSCDSILPILSQSFEICNTPDSAAFQWDQERLFSIPIPSDIEIGGRVTSTPPSFYSLHQNISCEVYYELKFRLMGKRKRVKKNVVQNIKILYLPKSRPSEPPLTSIPRLSRYTDPPLIYMSDRVKTVVLSPYQPSWVKSRIANFDSFSTAVYLSLPSPQCFASGEPIPFTLSLIFPNEPIIGKLLMRNTRIQLLKRLRILGMGLSEPVERDTLIYSSRVRNIKEYTEGISLLRGVLQAGSAGEENSWQIENVAVEYILRITLRPPDKFVEYIPSFRHDEIVQITTDCWGSLHRELISIGTPTPALGLARNNLI